MVQMEDSPAFNLNRLKKMRDELGDRSKALKAKAAFTSPTAFVGARKKDIPLDISAELTNEGDTNNDNTDGLERRDDILNQIAMTTTINVGSRSRSHTPVQRVSRPQTPDMMLFASAPSGSSRSRQPTPEDRRAILPRVTSSCPTSPRIPGKSTSRLENNNVQDDSDLQFNDNAFLVVANMVLNHIRPKLSTEHDSYTLTKEELDMIYSLLPTSARRTFVDALRFRAKFLPTKSANDSSVIELVRECVGLGLDRPDDRNIMIGGGQKIAGGRVYVPNARQGNKLPTSDSTVATSRSRLQMRTNLSSSHSVVGDDAVSTRSRSRSSRNRANMTVDADADDDDMRSTRSRSTRASRTFASDNFKSRSRSRSPRSFKRFVPVDQRTDSDSASVLSSGSRMSRASRISRSSVMTPRQRRFNAQQEDDDAKDRINKREDQIEAQMKSLRDAQEMLAKQQMEFQKKQMETQQQQLKDQQDQLFELTKLKTMNMTSEMIRTDEADDKSFMNSQDQTDLTDVTPDFSWMKDIGITEDEITDAKKILPQKKKRQVNETSIFSSSNESERLPTMQILEGVKNSLSTMFRAKEEEIIPEPQQMTLTFTDSMQEEKSQASKSQVSTTENDSSQRMRSNSNSANTRRSKGSILYSNSLTASSQQTHSSRAMSKGFGIEIDHTIIKHTDNESCHQSASVGSLSLNRYIQDLNFESGSVTTKASRGTKSVFTATSKNTLSTNGANGIEIDSTIMEEYRYSQRQPTTLDTISKSSYMQSSFPGSDSIQTRSTRGSKSVSNSVASSTKYTIPQITVPNSGFIHSRSPQGSKSDLHSVASCAKNTALQNENIEEGSIYTRSTQGSESISKSTASSEKKSIVSAFFPIDGSEVRAESTLLPNSSASISHNSQVDTHSSASQKVGSVPSFNTCPPPESRFLVSNLSNKEVSSDPFATTNPAISLCGSKHGELESMNNVPTFDSHEFSEASVIKELDKLSADTSIFHNHSMDSTSCKSLGLSKISEAMKINKVDKLRAEIEETKILQERAGPSEAKQFWQCQIEDLQARLDEEITTQLKSPVRSTQSVGDDCQKESDLSATMIDITAPADFPAGYMFEARFDDRRFLAVVPHGGVKKGDNFSCKFTELESTLCEVPKYNWRDQYFDVLSNGVTHPFFLLSFSFPLLALGQVMTRMSLNWLGRPASGFDVVSVQSKMSSAIFLSFLANFAIVNIIFIHFMRGIFLPLDFIVLGVFNLLLYLFSVLIIARTRRHIRATYMIRQVFFGEDIIKTLFFMPFTLSQMGRHTADYVKYTAYFCTPTGLAEDVNWNPNLDQSSYIPPMRCDEQDANNYHDINYIRSDIFSEHSHSIV